MVLFYFIQMSGRKVILQTKDAPVATRSMSASVDKTGQFCFKVGPGVHHIQVKYILITWEKLAFSKKIL